MKQTMKSQLFPGPVSMAAHVRCWQSGRFNRSGWCPCQALASVSGNTESPRRRAAAGRPQDTRSHAAAAEFWCPPPSVRTEIQDLHAAIVLTP